MITQIVKIVSRIFHHYLSLDTASTTSSLVANTTVAQDRPDSEVARNLIIADLNTANNLIDQLRLASTTHLNPSSSSV